MKTIRKILYTQLILVTGFLFTPNATFAHFGTKGPYGGSVSCGIVNDTLVYFGTTNGGVFFSTKQALTGWSLKPVGLKSGKITALTHTTGYLFAGTADSGIFIYTGFVGSDRYWKKINNGLTNLKIKSLLAIDTITVLAGTDGGGLFKTVNKGVAWTTINSASLNGTTITGMEQFGSRIILTSSTGGVFKSDDKGATWSSFNDISTLNIIGTDALSYNATTDEVLIVNSNGLYVASSAGTTTTPVYVVAQTGLPASTVIRSISNNGTTWFLATDKGVYSSATGTINWVAQNSGLGTLDVNTVVPFQTRLIAGTNIEGIYKTAASAISWTANNTGFNNLVTYSMETSGAFVVIAATEKGVFVSKDLAATYNRANNGLTDSLNVTDLNFFKTKLYATTKNAGVFMSADTGKTWTTFNAGLTESNFKKVFSSTSNLYVFSSTGNIYSSSGMSWTLIQNGLPNGVTPTSLAFYGTNVLLGTLGNGTYTKSESATTWTAANTGLTNLNVTSVTTFGTKIYAGTDGSGVFVADAIAVNWTATSPLSISHTTTMGLDGSKVQAMATYGGYVFASYKGGLLATTDNGATWLAGGNQFNLPSYTDVNKISIVTTRVFVTTENNCLYSNGLSELAFNAGINFAVMPTCNGSCNGSATAVATGGTSPYTFSWSNGQSGSSLSNVCAATYTLTVTDALATSISRTVAITDPPVLIATLTSSPSSGTDGSVTANVSGGTADYSYSWNNGETTASLTGLAVGVYTVTVTDANGCTLIQNVTVSNATGISEINTSEIFNIIPNPTNGHFNINTENIEVSIKNISIYDGIGRLIENISINKLQQQTPVDFNYSAGIYYVQVITDKGIGMQKIIVE